MIHLVGLPHTPFAFTNSWSCAYTTKALNWLKVLEELGEEVTVYWGGDVHDTLPPNAQYQAAISTDEQTDQWGEYDPHDQPVITWGSEEPRWMMYNARVIDLLSRNARQGDIIAFWSGEPFRPVMEWAHKQDKFSLIEPAVGYEGIVPEHTSVAFESTAWMHHIYGKRGISDGRWFDAVIHGYADPDQFRIRDKAAEPYVLFLGRVIPRKGPHVASQIAERAGIKFICAGTGATWDPDTKIVQGNGIRFRADDFVGGANPIARAKLMAQAQAVLVPTLYIEPFGTVHIEAQMAGTVSIASPFGVFVETATMTAGGRTFRSPEQAVQMVAEAKHANPAIVREHAVLAFSPKAVAEQTGDWLEHVRRLSDGRYWYG